MKKKIILLLPLLILVLSVLAGIYRSWDYTRQ